MKRYTKVLSTLLAVLLVLSLGGCAHKTSKTYTYKGSGNYTEDAVTYNNTGLSSNESYDYAEEAAVDDYDYDYGSEEIGESSIVESKIITTFSVTVETENYDSSLKSIKQKTKELGGYIESESNYNYSNNSRYCYLTLRVPSDKAEAWVDEFGEYGIVRSNSKNSEDVTLTYVDYESKIKTLRVEEETLLGIMSEATEVSDLILIESELTRVRGEIESYQSQLNVLENKVSYTTISLTLDEVNRELPPEESRSVWAEIKIRFQGMGEDLSSIGRELFILLVVSLPFLAVIAVIIIVIVLLCKSAKKRRIKKYQEKTEKENK